MTRARRGLARYQGPATSNLAVAPDHVLAVEAHPGEREEARSPFLQTMAAVGPSRGCHRPAESAGLQLGAKPSRFPFPPYPREDRSQGPVLVATFLLLATLWAGLFFGNVGGLTSTGARSHGSLPAGAGAALTHRVTTSAPAAAMPPSPAANR